MSDQFDGYSIYLAEDEEGDFLAHFIEMPNVSAFAESPEQALVELKHVWEAMKESYCKHDENIPIAPARKEYSGQFNVRIDKRVHKKLAVEATIAGLTLNALVSQKLAQSVEIYC
jgi:predicted HicB family RNase H-like nuclease